MASDFLKKKAADLAAAAEKALIRDVVGERDKPRPNRLEGMTPIPAPNIVHGVTQFTG